MLSFLLVGVIAQSAQAGWFGPSSYEECITESMKGVTSDVAAAAIISACRDRYHQTEEKHHLFHLDVQQLKEVSCIIGEQSDNVLEGRCYNGNNEPVITEISLEVVDHNGIEWAQIEANKRYLGLSAKEKERVRANWLREKNREERRVYSSKVCIAPLSAAPFRIDMLRETFRKVSRIRVVGAKGYLSQ